MPQRRGDPQLADPKTEEVLLGALLTDPNSLKYAPWMDSTLFTVARNATTFVLLKNHWKTLGDADEHTFRLSLLNSGKLEEVGGSARFCELAGVAGVPELVPMYAEGLRQLAEKRKGLRRAGEMAREVLTKPGVDPSKVRWE